MSDGSGIFIENNVKISELVNRVHKHRRTEGEKSNDHGHWRKMSGKVFLCKRTF